MIDFYNGNKVSSMKKKSLNISFVFLSKKSYL